MTKIYLASNSPRRAQLLQQIGCFFEILQVEVDELIDDNISPEKLSMFNAELKAKAGVDALANRDAIVVAADTVVNVGGCVLGKPLDKEDAMRMLRKLSGTTHEVLTSVAVARGEHSWCATSVTRVTFCELSDMDIEKYVATGEPMDKAGAYGIQGFGALFVLSIHGCYFNVMGLPLSMTRKLLASAGVEIF